MGARIIATGNEHSTGGIDGLERIQRGFSLDFRWIGRRTNDDEIIVHHQLIIDDHTGIHQFFLGSRGMDQEHIRLSLLAHGQSLTGSHRNGLDPISGFLLKHRNQIIQKPGIHRRCRCGENHIFGFFCTHR